MLLLPDFWNIYTCFLLYHRLFWYKRKLRNSQHWNNLCIYLKPKILKWKLKETAKTTMLFHWRKQVETEITSFNKSSQAQKDKECMFSPLCGIWCRSRMGAMLGAEETDIKSVVLQQKEFSWKNSNLLSSQGETMPSAMQCFAVCRVLCVTNLKHKVSSPLKLCHWEITETELKACTMGTDRLLWHAAVLYLLRLHGDIPDIGFLVWG